MSVHNDMKDLAVAGGIFVVGSVVKGLWDHYKLRNKLYGREEPSISKLFEWVTSLPEKNELYWSQARNNALNAQLEVKESELRNARKENQKLANQLKAQPARVEALQGQIEKHEVSLKEARAKIAELEQLFSEAGISQKELNARIEVLNEEISLLNGIISKLEEELTATRAEKIREHQFSNVHSAPNAFNEIPVRPLDSVTSLAKNIIRK